MKSSKDQLRNRGYVTLEDIEIYNSFSKSKLIELLESKESYIRTIGVNLLSTKFELDNYMVNLFCNMLVTEKNLYTKIELCNALSKTQVNSIKIMLNYLGVIGNNQYKELPEKLFTKKSYPLPRDIIARTLAHMNIEILPELLWVLKSNDIFTVREVIDALGFICYYNSSNFNEAVLQGLILCMNKHHEDYIIRWKIVRSLESFNSNIALDILTDVAENDPIEIIRDEAKRSISIINKKYP